MRTITKTTNVYLFDELSESAKANVLQSLNDINVNDEWYDSIYNDANEIGLKITSFDLDRNRHAKGELINPFFEVLQAIKDNHGDTCDTYKLAIDYNKQWDDLVCKYSDGITLDRVSEDNEYDFDQEADELEAEFLKDLLEEYSIMLQHDYEYQCSDDALIETIRANEYEFDEKGNLI